MFSGIIDAVGEVVGCETANCGKQLVVRAPGYWADAAAGASVAVDGVCLTVTRVAGDDAWFDVVLETLRRSTLGDRRRGDRVNLQKSLAVGERIDGHFVQGHVDATAVIERIDSAGGDALWWFAPEAAALPFIIPKGSVAIDGISLTIAAVDRTRFSVALIPATLQKTTIGGKSVGGRVNIETDILARTVIHRLESTGGDTDAGSRSGQPG